MGGNHEPESADLYQGMTSEAAEKGCFSGETPEKHASGAKQAAEKVLRLAKTPERHPAGAKARVQSTALTARLKSCPDAYGAPTRVFPQPVKSALIALALYRG